MRTEVCEEEITRSAGMVPKIGECLRCRNSIKENKVCIGPFLSQAVLRIATL